MMKALNEKINNLYQSQNKNMGGKGLLWMALIFAVLSCYFFIPCLLYTSPSPRDGLLSRMPSSA